MTTRRKQFKRRLEALEYRTGRASPCLREEILTLEEAAETLAALEEAGLLRAVLESEEESGILENQAELRCALQDLIRAGVLPRSLGSGEGARPRPVVWVTGSEWQVTTEADEDADL